MQNLQTKYDIHSAQTAYLCRYQLLEEDETTEERHQTDFDYESDGFSFQEVDQQHQADEHLDFRDYFSRVFQLSRLITNARLSRTAQQLYLLLVGEVVEHGYLTRMNNQNSQNSGINHSVWIVTGHLFLICMAAITLPLLTCALIVALLIFAAGCLRPQPTTSEFEDLDELPREVNLAAGRLKLVCINSSQLQDQAARSYISQLVEQVAETLSLRIQIEAAQNDFFHIDRLDFVVHSLICKVKEMHLKQKFLGSSYPSRKFYYWTAKIANTQLRQAADLIDQTSQAIRTVLAWPQRGLAKTKTLDQSLYYAVLASKVLRLKDVTTPSQQQQVRFTQMASIILKQAEFRKVLSEASAIPQSKAVEEQEETPNIHSVDQFIRAQPQSLCFEDGQVAEYHPDDIAILKEKLEAIIAERLDENTNLKGQKVEETRQQILLRQAKKEITVFGIPIAPPQRDMTAYYIE